MFILDKQNRTKIQDRMKELLKQLEGEFPVRIVEAGYQYDRNGKHTTFKFGCFITDEDGLAYDPDAEEFKAYAHWYNLKPEDLGRTFTHKGDMFKIIGARTSARKYPILVQDLMSGTKYKYSDKLVCRCLGIDPSNELEPGPLA